MPNDGLGPEADDATFWGAQSYEGGTKGPCGRVVMEDKMSENSDGEDLRGAVRRIAVKVSGLELVLSKTARSETVKSAFDAIQSKLDRFTKEILASRNQRTLQDKSFNDLKGILDKHELRLTHIEKFGGKS